VVYIAQNNYLDICVIWVVVIRVICSFLQQLHFVSKAIRLKKKIQRILCRHLMYGSHHLLNARCDHFQFGTS